MKYPAHDRLLLYLFIAFMPALSTACVPLSAKDLRTSNIAGHIIFNVNDPQSVLHKRLFDISTKCLYGESGVVTQSFNKETGTSNINFAFTDAGYYLNTVTIDLVNINDAKTSVSIHYGPSINGRWHRYAEKAKEWALQKTEDCKF